jgi:hypothetical protein
MQAAVVTADDVLSFFYNLVMLAQPDRVAGVEEFDHPSLGPRAEPREGRRFNPADWFSAEKRQTNEDGTANRLF